MSNFEKGYIKNSLYYRQMTTGKAKKTQRFRGLDIQGSWNTKQNPQG